MGLELVAEIAAAGLAVWAAVKSVPRPPVLDWERLFKTALSVGIWGEVAGAGGDEAALAERVAAEVPYHPAGRDPQARLRAPDIATIPTPALPGERALVESLAALSSPVERFARMYADNEQTREALLSDPAALGADYDPVRAIGVGADWEAVSAWSAPVVDGLKRKLSHLIVAGVGTELAEVMAAAAGLRGLRLPEDGLVTALDAALSAPADRLVLVGEGEGIPVILKAMHAHPGLRDRVVAVISLGGNIRRSAAQQEWMAEHFTQQSMDTELNRATPYIGIILAEPDSPLAEDWDGQRWPPVAPDRTGRAPIQLVDLGPIPPVWLTEMRREALSRAMWVILAFWL